MGSGGPRGEVGRGPVGAGQSFERIVGIGVGKSRYARAGSGRQRRAVRRRRLDVADCLDRRSRRRGPDSPGRWPVHRLSDVACSSIGPGAIHRLSESPDCRRLATHPARESVQPTSRAPRPLPGAESRGAGDRLGAVDATPRRTLTTGESGGAKGRWRSGGDRQPDTAACRAPAPHRIACSR